MTTPSEHWNAIYSTRTDSELGWYEKDVSQTLKFLDGVEPAEATTVFLAGAGTSVLVDELLARGCELVLNDISDEALSALSARIGASSSVTWLHHDISTPLPEHSPRIDLWIDRAVLHFLLEPGDVEGYFANVRSALKPGGHVLLAEFSTVGAPRCAGLELHRYSLEELTERLGSDFELVRHEPYTYTNPGGDPRPYIYALFRRRGGE